LKIQCPKCSKVSMETIKQEKSNIICDGCGASIDLTSKLPQGIKRASSDLKNTIDIAFKDLIR